MYKTEDVQKFCVRALGYLHKSAKNLDTPQILLFKLNRFQGRERGSPSSWLTLLQL